MNKPSWYLIGIIFFCPLILFAQKKKNTPIESPVVVINEPEYVFSQGVGINIVLTKEKKDSGNNTLRQLGEMGARMIKLELPTNDKINLLMESSITHYIFTIKLDTDGWSTMILQDILELLVVFS